MPPLPVRRRGPCAWILATLVALASGRATAWGQAPPVERVEPAVRLAFVTGRVEVLTAEGRAFATAAAGAALTRGMRVRTGDDGRAELRLADGATLTLEPQSLLTLFGNAAPVAPGVAPSTTTTLQRGTLRVAAPPGGGDRPDSIAVATLALTVFTGRADVTLAAELGGHITRVAATRGRLRVRFGTNEYLLPALHAVREEVGRPLSVLRMLPRAPEWRRAPSTRAVSFGEPVDVEGTFGPGRRAATGFTIVGWRAEIARDELFHDRVADVHLGPRETRLRLRSLAPGTWYARLFALDPDRFESPPSAVARIDIAAPHVDPGALPAADRPGRRAALVIPRGFYCSLDGSPWMNENRPLPLDPARRYALRCGTTPDGRDARATTLTAEQVGPVVHTVRVGVPTAGSDAASATSALSIELRDAEGRPVSLAAIEVAGDADVAIDPLRETEPRGLYTAALRFPRATRTVHLRFTVNRALTLEDTVEIPALAVAAPTRPGPATPAPAVQVEVIRAAQPFRHPEDEEPRPDEEE